MINLFAAIRGRYRAAVATPPRPIEVESDEWEEIVTLDGHVYKQVKGEDEDDVQPTL